MMPGFATLARIAALALGVGIPAVVGVTLHRQYEHELAEAGTRAANTAHAVEQHAARTFEIIDTYLRAVAPLVGRHEGGLSTESVHAALREQVKRSRLYNIVIVDRDGRATVEGQVFPARALDIHDRDYFRTLRDRPGGGLLIGDPVTGRLSGKVLIPVARRIDGPDGSFSGIVQATLDPETFESVYAGIDNGPGAGLSLWRSDGTLLVRSPALPAVIGKNFADGENYRRHVPARDEAPYWTTAMTDGVERVVALGFLDDYPLYVAAALSRTDALAGWRRSAFVQASVAGGLTLVLVAALLQLAREFERRRAADGRIRASEERYRLLAENTNDLIVLKPSMRERAYVSPAVRLVLGWSPEEYAALAPEDLIHPDEMTEVISVYGSLSPDRPQASHVHRLRHRDGHYVWIESVFRLVGNIPGDRTVVVSGRDVTERIEADHALRASEARLRLVSEAAADMVTRVGRVDVDVRAIGLPDGRVRLRLGVVDTGVGVPASRRDRLFRRFSQADGSISRDFGGTGLGLAICKALVEAMGGTIGFDSQVGVGSTFWFEVALPLAPGEVTDRQSTRPVVKRVRRRLLLADDVALNRELAHEILTRAGHLVDLVEDGAAAVSAVRAKPYDLVLMDVQMPVLDGIAATRRIRASESAGSRMPIVAMTANVLPEQVESFLAAGMDAHVGKPFRVDQLLDVIDRLTVAVPTAEPPAPTTDATIHDDLIALVGRERFDKILAMLAEELRERFPATASADPRQLAHDAHAMISAAGALGFVELAQACREVEAACNGGHGYVLQLSTLRRVRDRTLCEIMALRSAEAA